MFSKSFPSIVSSKSPDSSLASSLTSSSEIPSMAESSFIRISTFSCFEAIKQNSGSGVLSNESLCSFKSGSLDLKHSSLELSGVFSTKSGDSSSHNIKLLVL